MKKCTFCGVEKPETQFGKRRSGRPKSWCYSCHRVVYRQRYAEGRYTVEGAPGGKLSKKKQHVKNLFQSAVRRGHIKRQPCEECGAEPAHGHHDDYSKPYEVRWLCPVHHGEQHRKPVSHASIEAARIRALAPDNTLRSPSSTERAG